MARGWWRTFFKDHPLYVVNSRAADRPIEVWGNAAKDKIKVFCLGCLQHEVAVIQDHEFRHGEEDPNFSPLPPGPLTQLALHLLSICPNSASCERLFSHFGLILTKLRTRLTKKTLVNLAEYKLHIRDEYLRDNTPHSLRKRRFGVLAEKTKAATGVSTSGPLPSTPTVPSGGDVIMAEVPTAEEDPAAEAASESGQLQTPSTTQAIRDISSQLISMLDDDDDSDYVYPTGITIGSLFDFTSTHWVGSQRMSAVGSLEAEMEYYDILDLDAIGDLEPDIDICETSTCLPD
ncbi:unnamed protein product [Cyclocybe aegerita]|uniref:HAT C-terminal dimerisation domain-containing protein n=1 Tax=Cyclocybe aegerita TaxID=1973307 RepID=A0A8S0VVG0_CYCAE|nr:unnamed protein product [Cyclocybe aegerita]